MANLGKWNTPTLTTVLSTELNGLTSGSASAASSAIANQTNLDVYADIEVNLASLSPGAGAYVAIYALVAVDGTNFPSPSAADLRLAGTGLLGVIQIGTSGATAQRVVQRNVLLPAAAFKVVADNQTGANFNASGNTVKFNIYDLNLNG